MDEAHRDSAGETFGEGQGISSVDGELVRLVGALFFAAVVVHDEVTEGEVSDAGADRVTLVDLVVAHHREQVDVRDDVAEPRRHVDRHAAHTLHPYVLRRVPVLAVHVRGRGDASVTHTRTPSLGSNVQHLDTTRDRVVAVSQFVRTNTCLAQEQECPDRHYSFLHIFHLRPQAF